MVAYSYKHRFVDPIRVGLGLEVLAPRAARPKRQTVRGNGKRRHARPGETIQHYCGLRTKQCFKIGEARCTETKPIELRFTRFDDGYAAVFSIAGRRLSFAEAECFVRDDGFGSMNDFIAFWHAEHGAPERWEGTVIYWEPLK